MPSNIEVAEGKPLKLEAKVAGKPEVQWSKDGTQLKPGDNVKIDKKPDGTVSLEIDQTKSDDSGKYELKVIDSKAKCISSSNVVVEGKINEK